MIDASRNRRRRHRSHVLTSLRISHDRGMSWPFAPSEDSSRDEPPSWPSPPLRLVAQGVAELAGGAGEQDFHVITSPGIEY